MSRIQRVTADASSAEVGSAEAVPAPDRLVSDQPLLLDPGYGQPSAYVRHALAQPREFSYHDPEWAKLIHEIEARLRRVARIPDDYLVLIRSGGVSAQSGALASILSRRKVLVVVGHDRFANRFAESALAAGLRVIQLELPEFAEVGPGHLSAVLARIADPIHGVFLSDCSNTAGIRHDTQRMLAEIRQVCPKALVILDSAATAPFDPIYEPMTVTVFGSNKNVGGETGGPSIVLLPPRVRGIVERRRARLDPTLDLRIDVKAAADGRATFAPSVPNVLALRAALRQLEEEGVEQRQAHQAAIASYLCEHLESLGLRVIADKDMLSPSCVAAWLPPNVIASKVVQASRSHGVSIVTADLPAEAIRIGTSTAYSSLSTRADVDRLIRVLQLVLATTRES